MKRYSTLWILIGFVIIIGCAHSSDRPAGPAHFEIDIPSGWQKHYTKKYFLIYKGDPYRQYIMVQERPIEKRFKHSKGKMTPGIDSQDAANIIIAELEADKRILDLKVTEKSQAAIKGNPGFKLMFSYRLSDGSTFNTLYYGFIKNDAFFSLRFNVAADREFGKDLGAFRAVVKSFRFIVAGTV